MCKIHDKRAAQQESMKPGQFYAGLFLLTFSTLALEVIETRILSVMTWYHLAFFAISAAMFGMTAGAIWVYRHAETLARKPLSQNLTFFTSAFAVSTCVSLALQMTIVPLMVFSASAIVVLLEMALLIVTVSAAVRASLLVATRMARSCCRLVIFAHGFSSPLTMRRMARRSGPRDFRMTARA